MKKSRNGEIDLLRFVFAMIIVMYHFSGDYEISWYRCGGVGVEFFFIVTGILMAKSAQSVDTTKGQIPKHTYSFLKRKVSAFYPYFISAILLQLVIVRMILQHETISVAIKRIVYCVPHLLMIQINGIEYGGGIDIGGSWFLSAMILALFILYPIILYGKEYATHIVFALIAILGLGFYFVSESFELGSYFVYVRRVIRAISEISLGAWGFGLASEINRCSFTKLSVVLLTIIKWGCFGIAVGYGAFGLSASYGALATIFCFIGITLSFSEKTIRIPSNTITSLFGKISLPIYLTHNNLVKSIVRELWGTDISGWKVWLIICACPIVAYFVMGITDCFMKHLKKLKPLFIHEESA